MKWDRENTVIKLKLSQQGDSSAQRDLVEENAPLVKSIVRRYLGRGVDYEDLYQTGTMGLIKAIKGFNPDFNVQFSTYAVPMISGEIKRFIRDNNTLKLSRSIKELQQKIRFAQQQFAIKNGREAGINDIAEMLQETTESIIEAMEAFTPCISLDEPVYDDGATVMDTVEDKHSKASLIDKIALFQCLDKLEERERKILMLRYFRNLTQAEIAKLMGVSQVQISRIESRSIEKLRKKMIAG